MQQEAWNLRRQDCPHFLCVIVQGYGQRSGENVSLRTLLESETDDWYRNRSLDLTDQDPPQFDIRLNYHNPVRGLDRKPVTDPCLDPVEWMASVSGHLEKGRNQAVEVQLRIHGIAGFGFPNVEPGSLPPLDPARVPQGSIGSSHSVRMDSKPPPQLRRAGQAFARQKIRTDDTQHDLGLQLFPKGHGAGLR